MADRLLELIREKALMRGDFTLSSGAKSTYYLNGKHITLDAEGSALIAKAILQKLQEFEGPIVAVGGPTIGADPMAGAVAAISHVEGTPVSAFLIRKEPKGHGTRSQVENCPPEGSRVVLLEDVVTTGGSGYRALKVLEEAGLVVAGVVCIVDREAGADETFAEYDYQPLYRVSTVLGDG